MHIRILGISLWGTSADALVEDTTKLLTKMEKYLAKMDKHDSDLEAQMSKLDIEREKLKGAKTFATNIIALKEPKV